MGSDTGTDLNKDWLEKNGSLVLIPISVSNGALKSENPKITLEIPKFKGKKFGEISTRYKGTAVKDGRISFHGLSYPRSKDKTNKRYKKASFLIDYDEPVFRKLAKEIEEKFGPKPTVEQLTHYVSKFIENKSMSRGYDIASRVANTKEGDCSEHAVLLAALARFYGYAARTLQGIVILEALGQYLASGHAWVEYRHNGKWHLADAALDLIVAEKEKVITHGYIPISVQKNEGPGYTSEFLMGAGNLLDVRRVLVE